MKIIETVKVRLNMKIECFFHQLYIFYLSQKSIGVLSLLNLSKLYARLKIAKNVEDLCREKYGSVENLL